MSTKNEKETTIEIMMCSPLGSNSRTSLMVGSMQALESKDKDKMDSVELKYTLPEMNCK